VTLRLLSTLLVGIVGLASASWGDDAPGECPVTFHPRGDESITLEGLLQIPDGEGPHAGVVICHPDPRYGGSMGVTVVDRLRKGLAKAGLATLRFNFRGIGGSTGEFDEGIGEVHDCLGALDLLRARLGVGPKRVALVGYSWGSWTGLRACVRDGKVPACACLSFPVPEGEDITGHTYFRDIRFPTLFVTGTADTISSLGTIRSIIQANGAEKRCRVVPLEGADHFFWSPDDLTAAVGKIVPFITASLRVSAAPLNTSETAD